MAIYFTDTEDHILNWNYIDDSFGNMIKATYNQWLQACEFYISDWEL
jgi:hypothetical protein